MGCTANQSADQDSSTDATLIDATIDATQDAGDGMKPTSTNPTSATAIMTTSKGVITIELATDKAPITTANFIKLSKAGFYDGLTFHRYVPGFVIQGGDPEGDGTGGSDETIPLEVTPSLTHSKGVIAMARSQDPNSASSQFYFTLEDAHFLDGNYAVFGKVIKGMDVVAQLREGEVIKGVEIQSE